MNGVASDIAIAGIDAIFSNHMRVDLEFVSKRLDIEIVLIILKVLDEFFSSSGFLEPDRH